MTRTIILPLDGSSLSERAIPFAVALARDLPARVVVMRAVLMPRFSPSHPEPPDELREAEFELTRVTGRLREAEVEAEWFVINDEAGWAINTAAMEQAADLIIMSTHGRGPIERSFLGSIADRVVRHGPAPVLLLTPHVVFNWPVQPRHLRIVVPLDGSPLSERAVDPAAAIARATDGQLVLVQAIEPPMFAVTVEQAPLPPGAPRCPTAKESELTAVAEWAAGHGIPVATEELIGRPADVVLEQARARKAHLIAMATHGRGGPARVVMGSVAEAVLRKAQVPLLLIGPHATAAVDAWRPADAPGGDPR